MYISNIWGSVDTTGLRFVKMNSYGNASINWRISQWCFGDRKRKLLAFSSTSIELPAFYNYYLNIMGGCFLCFLFNLSNNIHLFYSHSTSCRHNGYFSSKLEEERVSKREEKKLIPKEWAKYWYICLFEWKKRLLGIALCTFHSSIAVYAESHHQSWSDVYDYNSIRTATKQQMKTVCIQMWIIL